MDKKNNFMKAEKYNSFAKIAPLFILAALASLLFQCKVEPNETEKRPPYNLTIADSGRIGFALPSDTSGSAALTNLISEANDGVTLYAVKIGEENSFIFDVKKIALPLAFDMEYVFVEFVLKHESESGENYSYMIDYGIEDADGKRLRSKTVLTDGGKTIKIMYYFMKNDYDDCFYELSVAAKFENAPNAGVTIKNIAESFWFLD